MNSVEYILTRPKRVAKIESLDQIYKCTKSFRRGFSDGMFYPNVLIDNRYIAPKSGSDSYRDGYWAAVDFVKDLCALHAELTYRQQLQNCDQKMTEAYAKKKLAS